MIRQDKVEANATWAKDVEHLLPKITSLIVQGLHSECEGGGHLLDLRENTRGPELDIPVRDTTPAPDRMQKETKSDHRFENIWADSHPDPMRTIRCFLGGLSHCYNNILMGIWGNASLMRMVLPKDEPAQTRLAQIEDLIQNGSNLIHLLFGYIVERRSTARKIRLRQLTQEIASYNCISGNDIAFDIIETSISELSSIQTRIQMAACIARVADQMLGLIQKKRSQIDETTLASSKAATHLYKIDSLLGRGADLIRSLQHYAGARIPVKKSVSLKSILCKQINESLEEHSKALIELDERDSLPRLSADPHQIAYALRQLIDNALCAVGENGKIDILLGTLDSEAPLERCGVHMIRNYAVISVADTGKGMSNIEQAQIFDPFFTGHKGQGRPGLGLSAAAGIVRSHGGYIQVRSAVGHGSTFKLYLPMA